MITASLVLFHNDPSVYNRAIESFLNATATGELWISDNSVPPLTNSLFSHPRVHYFHNGANLGFGAGHNRALFNLPNESDLHLILNPDIRFQVDVLATLQQVMDVDERIGALMPRINFPDGSLQRLSKLLPSPMDLIFRRFLPIRKIQERLNQRYEIHQLPQDRVTEVPVISGCFLLARTKLLRDLGGFDERYFMYMEDVDLVRRIGDSSKVMYVPTVAVIHDYAKGSYINPKLLRFHIKSAVKYFFKWGWIFDKQRRLRNANVLGKIR